MLYPGHSVLDDPREFDDVLVSVINGDRQCRFVPPDGFFRSEQRILFGAFDIELDEVHCAGRFLL